MTNGGHPKNPRRGDGPPEAMVLRALAALTKDQVQVVVVVVVVVVWGMQTLRVPTRYVVVVVHTHWRSRAPVLKPL